MTRKELLAAPKRDPNKKIVATGVYVIPTNKKHDSGYRCMSFVAETEDGLIQFGGCCDDVSFEGEHFSMDCDFKTKLLHVWNRNKFEVIGVDFSSIRFIELKEC